MCMLASREKVHTLERELAVLEQRRHERLFARPPPLQFTDDLPGEHNVANYLIVQARGGDTSLDTSSLLPANNTLEASFAQMSVDQRRDSLKIPTFSCNEADNRTPQQQRNRLATFVNTHFPEGYHRALAGREAEFITGRALVLFSDWEDNGADSRIALPPTAGIEAVLDGIASFCMKDRSAQQAAARELTLADNRYPRVVGDVPEKADAFLDRMGVLMQKANPGLPTAELRTLCVNMAYGNLVAFVPSATAKFIGKLTNRASFCEALDKWLAVDSNKKLLRDREAALIGAVKDGDGRDGRGDGARHGGRGGGRGRGGRGARGAGAGTERGGAAKVPDAAKRLDKAHIQCRKCKGWGHIKAFCPSQDAPQK